MEPGLAFHCFNSPRIVPVCIGCTSAPTEQLDEVSVKLLCVSGCEKFRGRKKKKEKVRVYVALANDLNMTKKCVLISKKSCMYLKAFPVANGKPSVTFLGVN